MRDGENTMKDNITSSLLSEKIWKGGQKVPPRPIRVWCWCFLTLILVQKEENKKEP